MAIHVYNGFKFELKKQTLIHKTSLKLSLIIAAKNEEKNISQLISSLKQLQYPDENLEVIFVDDNSTDNTFSLIESKIKDRLNWHLIKTDNKKFEGKKGALDVGIENSTNDFILITDADCKPEFNWLKIISSKLDAGFDFIFGIAPIESGKNFVQKLSAFENLRITFLTFAAVGINIPYSAAARNFAFRKKSFERIGGYSKTTETISGDDDLLLREAVRHKMLIGTIMDPESSVYSEAPKTWEEYYRQKKRHLKTSFHYLLKQKLFLISWHLLNILSLFSILFVLISPFFALPFFVKIIYDLFIIIKHQHDLGHSFKFYEVFYLQIFFEVFLLINFFNSFSAKVEWK